MNRGFVFLTAFLLSATSLAAQGQAQQAPQTSTPSLRSTTQEVVLDMVFRDKKGRTVHDIRPEEIHVLEDGVEQKLTSFRLVEGKTAESLNPPKPGVPESVAPTLDPMREVRLVTLVFEGLDQEGRGFFRQALKDMLDMRPEQNLYFAIMTIDQKLHIIQPFTNDHSALLKSVDKSSMWSFVQYQNQSTEVKSNLKQVLSAGEPQLESGARGGASTAQIQGIVSYRMAKMQYDMLQEADAADREHDARATIEALMALVRAQSELPGRKIILYFNPWLFIPEAVKELYANMIGAANRANVSFYTVDPKGLVTWSQGNNGREWLSGATGEIRSAQMRGGVGEVSAGEARAAEGGNQPSLQEQSRWHFHGCYGKGWTAFGRLGLRGLRR